MEDQYTLAETAAQSILQRTPLRSRIGLVLGSGLGAFADSLTDPARIPFSEIPAFPRSTAIGHAGEMVIGKSGSVPVARDAGISLTHMALSFAVNHPNVTSTIIGPRTSEHLQELLGADDVT